MVDNIKNTQPPITQKKDNTARNTAIATGIGLAGGGSIGYLTKQIYKNDQFTDEFINEINKQTINYFGNNKKERKFLNNLSKLDDNATLSTIKKFLKNNKKFIETTVDEKMTNILKLSDSDIFEVFTEFKNGFNTVVKTKLDAIKNLLPTLFDKDAKKFTPPNPSTNTKFYDLIVKSQQRIKGKAGLFWGITAGTVLGLGAFIASKPKNNKQA